MREGHQLASQLQRTTNLVYAVENYMTGTGSKFSQYVWEKWWLKVFSPDQGWECERRQRFREDEPIIDFTACRGSDRIIGSAVESTTLAPGDLENLILDGYAFKANQVLMLICEATDVPTVVREHAIESHVRIFRVEK